MKTRLKWLALVAVAVLCIGGVKISQMTQTTVVPDNALFIVSTNPGFAGSTRSISATNLVTALSGMSTWPSANNISGTNVPTTNATMFGLFADKSGSVLRYYGIEQGTNAVLYFNGSNVVVNAQPGGAASSAVSMGGLVFVATNGDNQTGTRGRLDKPFLTPRAAWTNAIAGDTIVVLPGTYTAGVTNLLKDQVNWWFEAGAVISNANMGLHPFGIFNNSTYGLTGPVRSTIGGHGTFIQRGGWDESDIVGVITCSNVDSRITIECDSILGSSDASTCYLIADWTGQLVIRVRDRIDASWGPTETSDASMMGGWWWGWAQEGQNVHVSAPRLISNRASAIYNIAERSGNHWGTFDQIISSNASAIWLEPTHIESKFWLHAKEIIGASNALSRGSAISMTGGKFYLSGVQKISGFNQVSNELPIIKQTNGILWLEAQKITTTNNAPWFEQTGGQSDYRVIEWQDLGAGAGTRPYNFLLTGGTNVIQDGRASAAAGPGYKITGGQVHLKNFTLDTSRGLQVTNYGLWITGGTNVIEDSVIIPGGTNSVFASSAQNLRIYGSLMTRSNVQPNITILSGDLVVNDNVDR